MSDMLDDLEQEEFLDWIEEEITRDVHNRCVVCGRPPSEACCPDCPHPEET